MSAARGATTVRAVSQGGGVRPTLPSLPAVSQGTGGMVMESFTRVDNTTGGTPSCGHCTRTSSMSTVVHSTYSKSRTARSA
jgi:hypothetical protein